MDKNVIFLRVSYWTAAIADFIVAFLVLQPSRMGVSEFVYPMGLMSAVAFSWGILLIIADRKPVERRWVILPTILVVFLLGVTGVYSVISGILQLNHIIISLATQVLILCLLIYTWFKTRTMQA